MKRALLFVLPQALLVPCGFVIGLVWGAFEASADWAGVIGQLHDGHSGAGPGHAGGALFTVLAAVVAILGLAIASSITLAGLGAGLMGAMYGFVLSCLCDWLLLFRRRLAPRDLEAVKRWAGRGALCTTAFSGWILLFNPLRDVAGVFAVTGTFVCLGFGAFGVVRLVWARSRKRG